MFLDDRIARGVAEDADILAGRALILIGRAQVLKDAGMRRVCDHRARDAAGPRRMQPARLAAERSEEHTSELPSLMRISYAVFCLHKKHLYTLLSFLLLFFFFLLL